MSEESRVLAGVLLLALVTVETGGLYLVRVVRGHAPTTQFQTSFARAGHAHAGVLLVLALMCQLLADETGQRGLWDWLSRSGVALAALLMPAGFFFCSMGQDRTEPSRLIVLVFAGALVLAAGLTSLGVGLLTAG
ncbi:hypothetical protein BH18ACT9_BH18ACT9_14980 [soil metagenome]